MTAPASTQTSRPVRADFGEGSAHPGRDHTYTSEQVCRMASITYRQLDHWVRTGLLRCSYIGQSRLAYGQEGGSGTSRRFNRANTVRAMAVAHMLRQGIAFPAIRVILRHGQVATVTLHPLPEVDP